VSGGDHRWFKRSAGKKRPVTRKDDDYDNDDDNKHKIFTKFDKIIDSQKKI
jgi:hypothetical protein